MIKRLRAELSYALMTNVFPLNNLKGNYPEPVIHQRYHLITKWNDNLECSSRKRFECGIDGLIVGRDMQLVGKQYIFRFIFHDNMIYLHWCSLSCTTVEFNTFCIKR